MRFVVVLFVLAVSLAPVLAQQPEPIAFVGHGGFFDQNGKQIEVTPEWVAKTQAWYRENLLAKLPQGKKAEFAQVEQRLAPAMRASGQARLVAQHRALDWLIANTEVDSRTKGKLNSLRYALEWDLNARKEKGVYQKRERFRLNPDLEKLLSTVDARRIGPPVFLSTTNSGQLYIDECTANQVPIPPSIGVLDPAGTAGWKSQGFIPTGEQFIVGTPAEVRTYTSPMGTCFALPRYSDGTLSTVELDGVICLSAISSKVCFWDNQMLTVTFPFAAGDIIPIGVPASPGGRYQAGGFELEGGDGVCTDCHAGENPYIIHPFSDLGAGNLMGGLDGSPITFGPNRYDPIVAASWPQNNASQAAAFVPAACNACHVKGDAGRFPQLSTSIKFGYCMNVLYEAINRTMPPGAPGSLASDPAIVAFKAWCDAPATSSTADYGDPHLTTVNGVRYDFQSGGEFVSLRNADTRFELQTRQRPVSTTFTPGANPYTGLASCVSLNTAAALRMGGRRVTYQPGAAPATTAGTGTPMELRVDGSLVTLPPQGLNLGGGNWIARAGATDGIDARAADGTRVIITPEFWTSEGYSYLNVDVLDTPAREGILGYILAGDWLPRAPNGSSFGPKPASIPDRHTVLNRRFADAWRVTNASSLFDYAPGTSTADFTFRDWPPEPGKPCVIPAQKPIEPMPRERAVQICSVIKDKEVFENCVFDAIAMNEPGVVRAYQRALKARGDADVTAPGCLGQCPPPHH